MRHLLSSALFAGFVAGLLCALLQYLLVEPKILLAERYESGELVHFQGVSDHHASADMANMDMSADEHEHHHDAAGGEVSPAKRHALTVLFAVLTYCGYGLVLIGGIQLAEQVGIKIGFAQSLLWGLAGFMAFQLMPALGLAPELPGTPAADLGERQMWWVVTAMATIFGLWFAFYGTALWQRTIGVIALVAPHVWGAPELGMYGGFAPPELAAEFTARSLAVGLITWMALGAVLVKIWHSEPAK